MRVVNQKSLFADATSAGVAPVPGLRYLPELLTEAEEQALTAELAKLPLKPFGFHGYFGHRRVVSFGLRYDHTRHGVEVAPEPPRFLSDLRLKIAAFAEQAPEDFCQIGVNEYPPGAGIGWHRDKPEFGDVVGISLVSAVRVRFRKRNGHGWLRASQIVEPRSVYAMTGAARHEWEHSIAPVESLRYSLMFRTLVPEPVKK